MSGLAATETRLDHGAVDVRIGEGRTAEVLRNLCFQVHEEDPSHWERLVEQIENLFGTIVDPPRYTLKFCSMRLQIGIWLWRSLVRHTASTTVAVRS